MIHKNIPKEGIKYKKKRLLNKQKSSVKTCLKKKVRSITRNKKNAKSKTGDYDRKAKLKFKTLKESKKLPTKTSPKNNKIKTKRYKRGGNRQNEQNLELQYIIKNLQKDFQLAKEKTQQLMYSFKNFFPFKNVESLPLDQQKKELEKYVKFYKNVINAIDEELFIRKKMKPFFKLYPDIEKDQFYKYLMKMKESTKEYKKMSDKSDDLIEKRNRVSNYKNRYFSTILDVLPKRLNIYYDFKKIVFIVHYYLDKMIDKFSRDEKKNINAEMDKIEMILYERPEIMTEFGSLHR